VKGMEETEVSMHLPPDRQTRAK